MYKKINHYTNNKKIQQLRSENLHTTLSAKYCTTYFESYDLRSVKCHLKLVPSNLSSNVKCQSSNFIKIICNHQCFFSIITAKVIPKELHNTAWFPYYGKLRILTALTQHIDITTAKINKIMLLQSWL
jgi:hypothetical protein